jgi:hypothetical protein
LNANFLQCSADGVVYMWWCLQCDNSRIVYYYQCCGCCCYLFDGGEDNDGERRGVGCIALRLLYLPIVLPPSPFSPCHRPGTIPHLVSALWIPFPVPSIRTPSLVPRRVHRYVSRSSAIFMVFLLPVLDCCHPAYLLTSWKGQYLHVRRFCWLCPSGERHCDALRNGLKFGILQAFLA